MQNVYYLDNNEIEKLLVLRILRYTNYEKGFHTFYKVEQESSPTEILILFLRVNCFIRHIKIFLHKEKFAEYAIK